jgi:hypothetical protein
VRRLLPLVLVAFGATGCASMAYTDMQNKSRAQCSKLPDHSDYKRCRAGS